MATGPVTAQDQGADPYEQKRATCMHWMMTDYPTGLDESWCVAEFDLPSAFLIKCSTAQRIGFKTNQQREACRVMFQRAADKAATGFVLLSENG